MVIRDRRTEAAERASAAAADQPAQAIGSPLKAIFRRLPLPDCLHHQFTLTGLNLERFLNTLQKEQITLVSARRLDHRTLRCVCRSSDVERISSLVQEKGWRMEKTAPVGIGARIRHWLSRPGLIIGLLLAAVLLAVTMRFVWVIRIVDAGAYQADMAAYLSEEGIKPGIHKEKVDAATLALLLQRRYPEVAWFRVYVNNVTLVVECTQGVPTPALPQQEPCHLVAARDGVVQSVQVYAGTAMVRPGDLVRKGQILIRGEERSADGEMLPVAARGQVVARCWQEETVRLPLRETISQETGRNQAAYQLCTPWLCWPETLETPEYLTYQLYLTDTPLGGCFFPVWQRRVEYREVALTNGQRPAAEVEQEAKVAAEKKLRQTLRGYVLLEQWMETRMGEDGYVYATASGEYLADLLLDSEGQPCRQPYTPVQ